MEMLAEAILTDMLLGMWTRLDFQFPKGKEKSKNNVNKLHLMLTRINKAYFILDELLIAGELQETSKKSVLRVITQEDQFEEQEGNEPKAG